jgi:hypothetical protein
MTVHFLKIDAKWLKRVEARQKTAELRKDDRDYQTGDIVELLTETGAWTGVRRTITHVLRGDVDGLEYGYVILSLEDPRIAELKDLRARNETLVRSNRSLRARARSLTAKLGER